MSILEMAMHSCRFLTSVVVANNVALNNANAARLNLVIAELDEDADATESSAFAALPYLPREREDYVRLSDIVHDGRPLVRTGTPRLLNVQEMTDGQMLMRFGLSQAAFIAVHRSVERDLNDADRRGQRLLSTESSVALTLRWLRSGLAQRDLALDLSLSERMVSDTIHDTLYPLFHALQRDERFSVCLPSPEMQEKLAMLQQVRTPDLVHPVWLWVDGTHVMVQRRRCDKFQTGVVNGQPVLEDRYYSGYCRMCTSNSVFGWDSSGRLRIASVGHPGRIHDSTIMEHYVETQRALLADRLMWGADGGFRKPSFEGLIITPGGRPLAGVYRTLADQAFVSARQLVEHCIGNLKRMWRILLTKISPGQPHLNHILQTSALLYNVRAWFALSVQERTLAAQSGGIHLQPRGGFEFNEAALAAARTRFHARAAAAGMAAPALPPPLPPGPQLPHPVLLPPPAAGAYAHAPPAAPQASHHVAEFPQDADLNPDSDVEVVFGMRPEDDVAQGGAAEEEKAHGAEGEGDDAVDVEHDPDADGAAGDDRARRMLARRHRFVPQLSRASILHQDGCL